MRRFLPIGSVVLLKDSQRRVMIVGVKQRQVDTGRVWDYSGCLYPEGIMDPNKLYLFDMDQIDRLYFVGLQDGEGLSFLEQLSRFDAENQSGKDNHPDDDNQEDEGAPKEN